MVIITIILLTHSISIVFSVSLFPFIPDCSCQTLQVSLSNGALLEYGSLEGKYVHDPFGKFGESWTQKKQRLNGESVQNQQSKKKHHYSNSII